MPERERTVLTMYYYDGLTLTEIGAVLGVTESRVCQIHTKALRQLRSKLADRTDTFDRRATAATAATSPAHHAPRAQPVRRTRRTRPHLELLAS
jgi:hypothetical protein